MFEIVCLLSTEKEGKKGDFYQGNVYLFKVNNRTTSKRCKISSKLTIKTPKRRRRRSGVFIFHIEHISHFFLVFQLLT